MPLSIVQTRVDSTLKREAEEVFSSIGMDMATGIRVYLAQVASRRSIPFELVASSVPSVETIEAMMEGERLIGDPTTKRYTSFEEMKKDILGNHA